MITIFNYNNNHYDTLIVMTMLSTTTIINGWILVTSDNITFIINL
jgi:hypothetical protein